MDELNESIFETERNFALTVRETTMPTILSMQPATWTQHRLTMRQISSVFNVATIRTSGESCEQEPSSFVGGATEIFHKEIFHKQIVIEIATEIANEQDKVATIRTSGESCEQEPSSFVGGATEIFHKQIVIEIATEIANEQDKVAAIRTSGESCDQEPSSFVGVATEISNEQPSAIVHAHATELSTEMATNILYELELQLLAKLENEIDTHFQNGLDIATVQTLLKFDPTLQPRMNVGIEIEEHLQCVNQN
jgi:hypothetical protein